MAICNALDGNIVKSCDNNTGGVRKMYIADYDNITAITVAGSPEEITAVTMVASTLFYEFEFNRNTSSFTEDVAIDLTSGSTYFNQGVNLMLNRREASKRDAIEKLIAGQKKLVIIVLDSNGIYWLFGKDEGSYATTITGGSGIAKADKNGYEIAFTAEEPLQAFTVDPTIIAALLV
jgi:hypothetical protein